MSENGYVTREQWTAPDERNYEVVEIQGFGKIRIRSLTEEERSAIEAPNITKDGKLNIQNSRDTRCRAIAAAVVNDKGDPILSNADVKFIRKKKSWVIGQAYNAIAKLSGLDNDSREAAEKNFEETSGDSSPTS